jgi:hypothetical protein
MTSRLTVAVRSPAHPYRHRHAPLASAVGAPVSANRRTSCDVPLRRSVRDREPGQTRNQPPLRAPQPPHRSPRPATERADLYRCSVSARPRANTPTGAADSQRAAADGTDRSRAGITVPSKRAANDQHLAREPPRASTSHRSQAHPPCAPQRPEKGTFPQLKGIHSSPLRSRVRRFESCWGRNPMTCENFL